MFNNTMAIIDGKTVLFRFVTTLTFVLLFGVLLLPSVITPQVVDCDDNCTAPYESVCICIGCTSIVLGIENLLPTYSHARNVLAYSIITPSIDIQSEWRDRVDRPPKALL